MDGWMDGEIHTGVAVTESIKNNTQTVKLEYTVIYPMGMTKRQKDRKTERRKDNKKHSVLSRLTGEFQ